MIETFQPPQMNLEPSRFWSLLFCFGVWPLGSPPNSLVSPAGKTFRNLGGFVPPLKVMDLREHLRPQITAAEVGAVGIFVAIFLLNDMKWGANIGNQRLVDGGEPIESISSRNRIHNCI